MRRWHITGLLGASVSGAIIAVGMMGGLFRHDPPSVVKRSHVETLVKARRGLPPSSEEINWKGTVIAPSRVMKSGVTIWVWPKTQPENWNLVRASVDGTFRAKILMPAPPMAVGIVARAPGWASDVQYLTLSDRTKPLSLVLHPIRQDPPATLIIRLQAPRSTHVSLRLISAANQAPASRPVVLSAGRVTSLDLTPGQLYTLDVASPGHFPWAEVVGVPIPASIHQTVAIPRTSKHSP